jgi:lipoprotein-releasing system permease protein
VKSRGLYGALLATLSVLGPVTAALLVVLLTSPDLFTLAREQTFRPYAYAAVGTLLALATLALFVTRLSRRVQRGTPGRLRGLCVGYGFALGFLFGAGALLVVSRIALSLPSGATVTLEEALLLSESVARYLLIGLLGSASAALVVAVIAAVSAWFLIKQALRNRLFWLIDSALLAACVYASLKYGFKPQGPSELSGSSVRLVLTVLLGVRIALRALAPLLNLFEQLDVRALIAARHLRAKKSGFLAAIAFLSILAVSVSSCALTTTLSVMGGFRQDLKRKILGNNAHIVIDDIRGRIKADDDPSSLVRTVRDVRGVSTFVSGEVMISSSSNLAGAVLRGIDPEHVAEVSELPRNMTSGSLDALVHPEKLTRLPASQFGIGQKLALPKVTRGGSDDDAKAALPGKRLTEQLDEALGKLEAKAGDAPNDDLKPKSDELEAPGSGREARELAKVEPTLPTIIVGQELARSLRLYVGDEVNIITPLGALGPTGPMPKSRPFRVGGIFFSGMYEYDMKFAYVTLEAAQQFLGRGQTLSGVEVTVREPDRAQEIASSIATRLAGRGLRVRPWQELNKNLFGALALEKLAMFIALGIAILVASFCIVGTLTLMVQEKGREVAVLKAMGAKDQAIVGIFVLEGTLIGVFGALLGLMLGYAMCFFAENFGVRLNPEVYYIDKLPVHIDPLEFLAVGVSAVFVCLLVTIYPAQLASRLRPVDALRFE